MNEKKINESLNNLNEIQKKFTEQIQAAFSALASMCLTLNAGGLVATLAFIGTTYSEFQKAGSLPFMSSSFFFGIGLLFGVLIVLGSYIFSNEAIQKYMNLIRQDTEKLVNQIETGEVWRYLSNPTQFQDFATQLKKWGVIISLCFFIIGLISGGISLFSLAKPNATQQTVSASSFNKNAVILIVT